MKLSISLESVAELREWSEQLSIIDLNLLLATSTLNQRFQAIRNVLGPHSQQFEEMISEIVNLQGNCSESLRYLRSQLSNTVVEMEDFIYNNPSWGLPLGWISADSMKVLRLDDLKRKVFSITINGKDKTYSCDICGINQAYQDAVASDSRKIEHQLAMIRDLEIFRNGLQPPLTSGDVGVAQIGGYYKDVRKQEPAGYEAHHIPAMVIWNKNQNKDYLPAIALLEADHKDTPSFRWKAKLNSHRYYYSSETKSILNYYQDTSLRIKHSGFIVVVKREIMYLRKCTGSRYDGAISAYLDAVIDLILSKKCPVQNFQNSENLSE